MIMFNWNTSMTAFTASRWQFLMAKFWSKLSNDSYLRTAFWWKISDVNFLIPFSWQLPEVLGWWLDTGPSVSPLAILFSAIYRPRRVAGSRWTAAVDSQPIICWQWKMTPRRAVRKFSPGSRPFRTSDPGFIRVWQKTTGFIRVV